ncbi:MAG: transporter substrate-binding domain-containing protein, partial [Roseiarcus sp.]|uniref:transporter substrate-binding domain-containing protein n=1 Tax=Roseiarcus sp. TaxID=1969460 RepID=UPI003C1F7B74
MLHRLRSAAPLVLLLAGLLALAAPASAQTRLDDILARGVLRVGATGDYPPFAVRGADGAYSGLDIDAAQALGAALGVKVEFVATR